MVHDLQYILIFLIGFNAERQVVYFAVTIPTSHILCVLNNYLKLLGWINAD